MGDAARTKALQSARKAQAEYDKALAKARTTRRTSFERAQAAGSSLREIGEAVGLHWTTVREIIKGK